MQPRYEIEWSPEFVADKERIYGNAKIFGEAFSGYDWYLCRLPRGEGTWDLNATGDLRLGSLPAGRLPGGTDIPAIYFTFQLRLGASPTLELLRAYRCDDSRLLEVAGGSSPTPL
jgi:hypothetical protein